MDPSFQFTETAMMSTALEYTTWITGIGVLVVGLLFICKNLVGGVGKPQLPPGPRNWPVVGALFSIDKDPRLPHALTRMAKKYGPVYYYRVGQNGVFVVSSSEGAEEVLKQKDIQFANRPNTTLFRTTVAYLGFNKQSFAMSDNNSHLKTLRRVATMQFFTTAKLSTYENMRRYEGAVMMEGIRSTADVGAKINVRDVTVLMSTNITCTMLFRKRFPHPSGDEFRLYRDIATRYVDIVTSFNLGDLFPSLDWLMPPGKRLRYQKLQEDMRRFLGKILEEHRQARSVKKNYEDRDLADVLLTLEKEGQVSEDAIMGCLMDMLTAGIETSSTTAEWALLRLVRCPESLAKLQKEIDTVVSKDRQVEESDFESMPYLLAVVMETFRLHSPTPLLIPHCNRAPTTLGGYHVPADTTVFVNTYAMGRDPRVWENPDEFQPERFLGSSSSKFSVTGGNFEILPFGSGRRSCVGYSLGMLVAQRMVASLVHSFDWAPPHGLGIYDLCTKDGLGIINQPDDPLVLSATARLEPSVYNSSSIGAL